MRDLRVSLVLILAAVIGCRTSDPDTPFHLTRFAMGTIVEYTIVSGSNSQARERVASAHAEMERISSLLWEGDSLSAIFRFNNSTDSSAVGPEVMDFVDRSRGYTETTRGAFDITIGPVLSLYNFGSVDPRPPDPDALRDRLAAVGVGGIRSGARNYLIKNRPEVRLAVGGVAKGYGVDKAVAVLRKLGVQGAVVSAGGDLYCLGTNGGRRWRVGVRDPDDPAAVVQVLHVADEAVATSGDYQQYFEFDGVRYHHILDPVDGRPANGLRSATVIAATAELADALATAAFILGPKKGLEMLDELGVDGLLIDSSGNQYRTDGLSKYLDAEAGP